MVGGHLPRADLESGASASYDPSHPRWRNATGTRATSTGRGDGIGGRNRSRCGLRNPILRRMAAVLAVVLALGLTGPAGAVTFSRDPDGSVRAPAGSACPTLSNPAPYQTWFNLEDMEERGYQDPRGVEAWDFSTKIAQIVCGAARGARIEIGMYFIRAIGTMTATGWGERPESDPEVVYDALEWVKAHRGVTIGLVLDGGEITPEVARKQETERLAKILDLSYCDNGCFNTN